MRELASTPHGAFGSESAFVRPVGSLGRMKASDRRRKVRMGIGGIGYAESRPHPSAPQGPSRGQFLLAAKAPA